MTSEPREPGSHRLRPVALGALALLLTWPLACESPSSSSPVGSNTNWLKSCDESAECGEAGSCVCGLCSRECASSGDCSGVPNARCATESEASARSQCRSEAPALPGICLARCEPGACGQAGACIDGACVEFPTPTAEVCAELPASDTVELAHQDRLLALVQALRTEGGIDCGNAELSVPVPALLWDARLACAARLLAADMAISRVRSLLDSAGRDSEERISLVGYSQRIWAEAFALGSTDEASARDVILADGPLCSRFVDAQFVHIGVGSAGDALVVTIGAE